MRRKLNVRLLLWTLASLVAVCTGAHLLHGQQVRRNASTLLRQAQRAVEQGHFRQAATYFHHYLAYAPDDLEALVGQALALDQLPAGSGVRFQAFLALERALRRAPERHDIRRRAVKAAIFLRRYPEAIRNLEALTVAFPTEGELEFQLAQCFEVRGDYTAAAAALTRALAKSPGHLPSYAGLAELLKRQNQLEDAGRVMDAMVKANSHSPQALLSRARHHRERGAADEAATDLERAAELAPEDADVLLAVADTAQARGRPDRARRALERGVERQPRDERLYCALAALELQEGRRAEAAACLRRGLKALPTSGEMLPLLADLLIEDGQAPEAKELSARLRKVLPSSPLPDYLAARALLQRGLAAEACDLLEQVRSRPGLTGTWAARVEMALARGYAAAGELDRRLAACRQAVRMAPGLAPAHVALAAAFLEAGGVDDALAELRPLAAAPGTPPEVWRLLARALLLRNVRLPVAGRQWQEVDAALGRARQATPGAPRLVVLQAELFAARGQPGDAAELLEKARAREPGQVLFWAALADLALLRGDTATAAQILARARAQLGDPLELRLALLRHAVHLKGVEARQSLERLARESVEALTRAERQRLLRPLAEALLSAGAGAEAERLWRRLARENPRDLHSRVRLLDLALQGGRDEDARAAVAAVRRLEGDDGALWRAGEAGRLIRQARQGDRAGLVEARKLLAEAAKRQQDWPRVRLLEAAADEAEGKADRAVEHYLSAVKLGERQPAALARLAQLLYERRRLADAARVLRLLEEQGPLTRDVARLAAGIALSQGEPKRAAVLARQAVSADSRDYRDPLWLARILNAAGERAEAEKVLRGAVAFAGRIPDTWVALVRHLARAGQAARTERERQRWTAEAEQAIEEARRRLPAERTTLALARCYEALGNLDRAEPLYRAALAARPADFIALRALADFHCRADEFARAEPSLRQLLDPGTGAPEEYVAWARRQLAVGLAATPNAKAFAEAMALLDRNARADGRDAEDERARAFVLATNPVRCGEALRLLGPMAAKQLPPREDQLLLVRAFGAAGEWQRARDLMPGLLAAQGDNPQVLAHHIRDLLRLGEPDDAAAYLERLERLQPHSRRTRELQAVLRKASGAA